MGSRLVASFRWSRTHKRHDLLLLVLRSHLRPTRARLRCMPWQKCHRLTAPTKTARGQAQPD